MVCGCVGGCLALGNFQGKLVVRSCVHVHVVCVCVCCVFVWMKLGIHTIDKLMAKSCEVCWNGAELLRSV